VKDTVYKKEFTFKGLSIELHPEVYDPAEDTFLLLDSIDINSSDSVLEIGTGCGIIALECARIGANVICSDINKKAVELVQRNYEKNKIKIKGKLKVRYGDLFSVVDGNEKFDKIIFNPPYLPIKKEEKLGKSNWLDIATNGGVNGLMFTKRFIEGLKDHLNKNGKGYFIYSSLTDKNKLETILNKEGFDYIIKNSLKFIDETIDVYQIIYKKKIMKE
jgi:release factor glutamine methyltransferase